MICPKGRWRGQSTRNTQVAGDFHAGWIPRRSAAVRNSITNQLAALRIVTAGILMGLVARPGVGIAARSSELTAQDGDVVLRITLAELRLAKGKLRIVRAAKATVDGNGFEKAKGSGGSPVPVGWSVLRSGLYVPAATQISSGSGVAAAASIASWRYLNASVQLKPLPPATDASTCQRCVCGCPCALDASANAKPSAAAVHTVAIVRILTFRCLIAWSPYEWTSPKCPRSAH